MSFLVISASAGTGKTHTLTAEITRRIREGELRADQIIATTFTVKAADELRSRIRNSLLDAGLVEEAQRLPGSLIGTVNSVAGQIVTDYAIDAGLSPDLSILDEHEAERMFRLALDGVLSAAESDNRELLRRTGYLGSVGGSQSQWIRENDWKRDVAEVAQAARANRIGVPQLRAFARRSWEELREVLGEPGVDRRNVWRSQFAEDLRAFAADAAPSVDFWDEWGQADAAAVKKAKADLGFNLIAKRSAAAAGADLEALTAWRDALDSDARFTWADWMRVPGLATGAAPGLVGKGDGKNARKPAREAFACTRGLVGAELRGNPRLHADFESLITLVMETAGRALEKYAELKRLGGFIDFTDQEVLALELLDQPRVCRSISSRYTFLAVDEFQDTSPIQLALFTRLRLLLTDVIWVGDPKQSIYGFRGTDPELMNEMVRQLRDGDSEGELRILSDSWRSTRPVIRLSNEIFTRMFTDMPRESIELGIPAKRAAEGDVESGAVEIWQLGSDKVAERALAIANGVKELLATRGFQLSDIAVLSRTGDEAARIAQALDDLGIPATTSTSSVINSAEGRIVLAALAYLAEPASDLPLIELIDLLPEHRAHETWFDDLAEIADSGDWEHRSGLLMSWAHDPSLAAFAALARTAHGLTPSQLIDAIIGSLRLTERSSEWPGGRLRLENLDALRKLAGEYEEASASKYAPVTLSGFLAFARSWEGSAERDDNAQAVFVETIHKSKGLGFRAVVVSQRKLKERAVRSGCFVYSAGRVNVADPLAGRQLRWWPSLLPDNAHGWEAGSKLVEDLNSSEHASRQMRREREDEARLLYVALTRSKSFTAIAAASPQDTAFASFEQAALDWDADSPAETIPLLIGGEDPGLRVSLRELACELDKEPAPPATMWVEPRPWNTPNLELGRPAFMADRIQASSRPSNSAHAKLEIIERLGTPWRNLGGLITTRIGEAFHACLAVPYGAYHPEERRVLIERLVRQWFDSESFGQYSAAQLLHLAASRFYEWADRIGATVQTEVPLTARNEHGQVMEGWIDALLTTADGELIVVDHKSYAGDDPIAHIAEHYLGQLAAYRSGVKAATGKAPRTLIHLSLRGEIVEVTFPSAAAGEGAG